jgi:hypothetical protein
MFRNTGINNSTPFIEVPGNAHWGGSYLGEPPRFFYEGARFEGFIVDGGGLDCIGWWEQGDLTAGAGIAAVANCTYRDILWARAQVGADLFGWDKRLENCYAARNTLDGIRAYVANVIAFRGGWYRAWTNAWAITILGNRNESGDPGGASILFDSVVIQPDYAARETAHGLRVSEGNRAVSLRSVYFEYPNGSDASPRYALDIGSIAGRTATNPSANNYLGTISAATNDAANAVDGVLLSGCKSTAFDSAATSDPRHVRFRFGNVRNVEWGPSNDIRAMHVEMSEFCEARRPPLTAYINRGSNTGPARTVENQGQLQRTIIKGRGYSGSPENFIICPNFEGATSGGIRGARMANFGSDAAVAIAPETTITRGGLGLRITRLGNGTTNGAQWGILRFSIPGVQVRLGSKYVFKAWVYVPDTCPGYTSTTYTDASTFVVPSLGMMLWDTWNGSTYSRAVSIVREMGTLSPKGKGVSPGNWHLVFNTVKFTEAPTGPQHELGVIIAPTWGTTYVHNADHFIVVEDMALVVDPPNLQSVLAGEYWPARTHGRLLPGGAVELSSAQAPDSASHFTTARALSAVGDRWINTAPAPGGWDGWVCTTAGPPGTRVVKGFGAIAA